MRDYGNHEVPVVSALPSSGVAGQLLCLGSQHYYWNTSFGAWLQIDDWYEAPLTTNYTNATTTLTNVFTFPGVINAVYAFEWKLLWQASTTIAAKFAVTVPSGSFNAIAEVTGSANGVVTPTFLELGTSGTSQTGPAAGAAATNYFSHGKGLVTIGTTAGSVALMCAANASGTITIAKGSTIKARRTV